jgi:hypothetical protein
MVVIESVRTSSRWARRVRTLFCRSVDRPGGVLFSGWATASVIRRQTAAPSEAPASASAAARAVLSASALSCEAVAGTPHSNRETTCQTAGGFDDRGAFLAFYAIIRKAVLSAAGTGK